MSGLPVDASLRQFARAVAADRFVGDELVSAIVSPDSETATGSEAPRADKFKAFLDRWRAFLTSADRPRPFSNIEFVKSVGPLPNEARLALLLNDLCRLTPDEIQTALGPLSKPLGELLSAERSAIASKSRRAKAVIVEDEPLIAADLQDVLTEMGIAVSALARTAEQGVRETLAHRPDIVLADFNLDGQKTGVDAVAAFQSEHSCPVVFITGYPDQVLKGGEVEPDFVIVKPYRAEAVRAAVAQCLDTARFRTAADD